MKSKMYKIFAFGLLLILVTLCASACGCKHEWKNSTCLAPRTCIRCGITEGKTRSHSWGNTACNAPEPCTVCGTMEGIELTHQWQDDCKICIYCGADERPADDRFLDALVRGLESRWELDAQLKEKETLTKEDWESLFDAEYQQIITFRDERFQNEDLEKYAVRYIDCIVKSKEALQYFETEQWADRYLNTIYPEQTVALYHIHEIRPVSAAEAYQEAFQEMLSGAETIVMIYSLFDQIMFLNVENDNGEKTYETTIKNTTTLDFRFFSFEVNLLDEDGNLIATEEASVNMWKAGEKVRFNFTTKEDFRTIDVQFANWRF